MKTPAQHTSQHTSQSCTPIVRVNHAAALTWSWRVWGPSIATGTSSQQLYWSNKPIMEDVDTHTHVDKIGVSVSDSHEHMHVDDI